MFAVKVHILDNVDSMKMEIETNNYWSEDKVYLFGSIVFLIDTLQNRLLSQKQMQKYFPYKATAEFERSLRRYSDRGYFEVEYIEKKDEPKMYILTNVNIDMFRVELYEYLNSFKLGDQRLTLLLDVASHQYEKRRYEPEIRWRDLYNDTDINGRLPFWELIFILEIRKWIQLKKISYSRTAPVLLEDGVVEKMPEFLKRRYEKPVVEFVIIDKTLQKKISKIRSSVTYKVSIILTARGKLQLSFDGKRYLIANYKSEKSNTYRAARALYDANTSLTRSELNLNPNSRTLLKGIIKNMHLTGILAELFIEYSNDGKNRQVVRLKHRSTADIQQHERLLEYVKTLNT